MTKKKPIVAIITGDIINSRNANPKKWLTILKKALSHSGGSPSTWEVFRGDSFQLEVKNPADALLTAIRIKANLKTVKGLDARMAIGIGEKGYSAPRITESNGAAFVYSGEKLESLKKEKQNLAVKSPWPGRMAIPRFRLSSSLTTLQGLRTTTKHGSAQRRGGTIRTPVN